MSYAVLQAVYLHECLFSKFKVSALYSGLINVITSLLAVIYPRGDLGDFMPQSPLELRVITDF